MQLKAGVKKTMAARVKFAAQSLRDRVVANISRPVRKKRGPISKRVQVDRKSRSKPGEFPRADTTRLMKDIFWRTSMSDSRAQVGTTLDYGLFLEAFMDRSFLVRTFNEMKPELKRILGTNYKVRFRK